MIPGGPPQDFVRVVEYQCYEVEPIYRRADPQTNQFRELDEGQFENLRRRLEPAGVMFVYRKPGAAQVGHGDGPEAAAIA